MRKVVFAIVAIVACACAFASEARAAAALSPNYVQEPGSAFISPPSEKSLILSWFDCVVAGNREAAQYAAMLTGMTEREILELSFVVRAARPLSAWRFKHGEILEIRRFPDRYELDYGLPDLKASSGIEEWIAYPETKTRERKYVRETRTLRRAGDGKMEVAPGLRKGVLAELADTIMEYRRRNLVIDEMEAFIESVRRDKNLSEDIRTAVLNPARSSI